MININRHSKRFLKLDANLIGNDYVCGDIHGCFFELSVELNKLNFDESKDRLFCVGDLVDRGPESHLAVEWLKKPWFFSCYGNHEDMVLTQYETPTPEVTRWHHRNGGAWFVTLTDSERDEVAAALDDLPIIIQVGDVGILHAEPPKYLSTWQDIIDQKDSEHCRETLIWGRSRVLIPFDINNKANQIAGISKIYVGHTVTLKPITKGNIRWIETGVWMSHWSDDEEDGYLTIEKIN